MSSTTDTGTATATATTDTDTGTAAPSSDDRPSLLRAAQDTPTSLWNDSADPAELAASIAFGAVGATCNPVIAYTVIKNAIDTWGPRLREMADEHPTAGESELGWLAVEELSVQAATLLEPAFRASGGRDGRLSMQTDPRLHRDAAALVEQAVHFSGLADNIIVKIPATKVGIEAMEEATYRGVSINATVSFTVAQALAVGAAIERGLDRRTADGLENHEFGSVVTIMGGRLDDWLKAVAKRDHVLIEPGHLEWAGVAALKKAHHEFVARGYRSRILSAAFRNHLQWSELVGGDLVVSPPFQWQVDINANAVPAEHRIDVPVDQDVLDALSEKLPEEWHRAYDVDGMTIDEFERFGACVLTLRQFLEADAQLDSLVRDIIVPAV